ncbi:MAG TPA: DNA-binding protein, partial [Nitrososphaeraceae archaeon]|nr:DNA-binding protein [Nitrososphaeraceae archaeon]
MSLPQNNNPSEEERKREAEAEAMRQKVLTVLLDASARQRLANVRMV